jgi:hypothetical protein
LVTNVVARYLDEEARFLAAVEKGTAAAERGKFFEEEMDARLEAMSVAPQPTTICACAPLPARIAEATVKHSKTPPPGW